MKANNKKVGILTFHKANNLGAVLQASALCKFINKNITDCEIIDFVPNNNCGSNIMQKLPFVRAIKNHLLTLKNTLSSNKASKFEAFRKSEMKLSSKTYYGDTAMQKAVGKYRALISGSDQILNSTLSGTSKSFYLHFDSEAKKISYASSFGRENISENEVELIKAELTKFNALSVREASAATIIKDTIQKDALLVVDPVFLLDKNDWMHTQNDKLNTPDKYIFVYSMEVSPNLEKLVEALRDKTSLPVVVVRGGGKAGLISGSEDENCGPRDFISYISNAEYVITNSFHGTAMSLILGKKFISIAHSTRNARLQNILEMVHAKDKLVPFDLPLDNVDFYINDGESLYPLLDKHIKVSKDFLINELKYAVVDGIYMKIGILTASRTNNIGTDLQALAMQWLFDSFSQNSVELINYKCDKLENSRKILSKKNLHGVLSVPYKISKGINHATFRKKYFQYSNREYDKSNISEIDYDLVVVGSDQIWNQNITGNDLNFFLPFHKNNLKASYAASISAKNIEQLAANNRLQELLGAFEGVSVRENCAANLLKEKNIDARCDLDPLLMIETEKWDEIASVNKPNKNYVLLYVVDRVSESVQFALDYAKKHDLDVYMWGNVIKPIKGVKPIRFKGIREWISYVKNADLIVTNSYHGLSFAINYQKNFAIYNLKNSDSNVRLENILELSGIAIQEEGTIYKPNWMVVSKSLDVHRENSRTYIANMLERAEDYATKTQE